MVVTQPGFVPSIWCTPQRCNCVDSLVSSRKLSTSWTLIAEVACVHMFTQCLPRSKAPEVVRSSKSPYEAHKFRSRHEDGAMSCWPFGSTRECFHVGLVAARSSCQMELVRPRAGPGMLDGAERRLIGTIGMGPGPEASSCVFAVYPARQVSKDIGDPLQEHIGGHGVLR